MPSHSIIERIDKLYRLHGQRLYGGVQAEAVTALEHALQCAQLAEWAHADDSLVAAALLHDVGHLLAGGHTPDGEDDQHEMLASAWLSQAFDADVVEPIRLHVQAKRYLCTRDTGYHDSLSPASRHTLVLQGGPMSEAEAQAFETLPHADAAVKLRRWDDLAKVPGRPTPSLDYYLVVLARLVQDEVLGGGWCAADGLSAL